MADLTYTGTTEKLDGGGPTPFARVEVRGPGAAGPILADVRRADGTSYTGGQADCDTYGRFELVVTGSIGDDFYGRIVGSEADWWHLGTPHEVADSFGSTLVAADMGTEGGPAGPLTDGRVPAAQLPPLDYVGKADIALNALDYGAIGDGVADDTVSLLAWMDSQVSTGRAGYLPAGTYRVTASLDYRDTAHHFSICGDGARSTFIRADFVGAGQGIIDLSDDTRNSGSHRISGIGFLGRGVPGDPVGLLLEHAWNNVVDDISAPNLGAGDVLANSVAIVTKDNNSKFTNVHAQSGWQPMAFEQSYSARASVTDGISTVTSDEAVFTAAMVGETVYLTDGSDTGAHSIWTATITAVDSATQVTIDTPAPSTLSDVKFRVGHVVGSVTSGSDQLVIDNIVGLSPDWVGMQVHVFGAATKPSAGGKAGLLSTRIAAVAGNIITLEAAATSNATDAVVLFAPPLFVGDFEGDPATFQTNHSWWADTHIEGYPGAGVIVNRAKYVSFDRLKVHGSGYFTASDWGECYYNAVFSEVETLHVNDVQSSYGIMGTKFHISGSYGMFTLEDVETAHLRPDRPMIDVVSPDAPFRLVLGDIHVADLVGFPAGYKLFAAPQDRYVEQFGTTHWRSMNGTVTKSPPVPVHIGATGQHDAIVLLSDTVVTWRPPGQWGTLHVTSPTDDVGAIVQYRTSEHAQGGRVAVLVVGTLVDVLAVETTLTGTTGTDGRVTIAADASGNLQIENRRNFGTSFAVYHTPYGT